MTVMKKIINQNTTLEMNITAYATQKANNGSNVFEASGWPA